MVNVDVSARPALRKIALESMHENTRKYEDCLCEAQAIVKKRKR